MHEQCSFVAIEMMMFGLPMIISTTTGLNEMMDNEDFGYHVAIENKNQGVIDDLANKIYSLLMCSTHRFSKLKLHSKMCFEKKYALCNIWRDYYEFFDMV
jgi:glycosyltransferase involved in cell wall biosynthesis